MIAALWARMAQFLDFSAEEIYGEIHHHEKRAGPQLYGLRAVLEQLASKRFLLELVTTHRFGLKDVDPAIKLGSAARACWM